jgi:hypothetical protein
VAAKTLISNFKTTQLAAADIWNVAKALVMLICFAIAAEWTTANLNRKKKPTAI